MMLGLTECDEETAYYLKYGKHKPYERNRCEFVPPCGSDEDIELYREFQQANYDEYFDPAPTYRHCIYGR